jgi:N-acetylglutamate synthase-like GNAT family acetyltransferase
MKEENDILEDLAARKCAEKDLAFVHDLSFANMKEYVDRHWGGWQDDLFWEDIKEENITIIKRLGEPVGFFDVTIEGYVMRLRNIQVKQDLQGQGVGRYMMASVFRRAKNQKMMKIVLRVFADNPAIGFYERLGFAVVEQDGSSLMMEKTVGGGLKIDYVEALREDEDMIRGIVETLAGDNTNFDIERFIIAKDGDKIVGCVRTKVVSDDCLELASVGVLPVYQVSKNSNEPRVGQCRCLACVSRAGNRKSSVAGDSRQRKTASDLFAHVHAQRKILQSKSRRGNHRAGKITWHLEERIRACYRRVLRYGN